MTNFVQENKKSGEVYLTPVRMMKFPIQTGAPVFVNDKNLPLKDTETIEWDKRLNIAKSFYNGDTIDCGIVEDLTQNYKVTHIVTEINKKNTICSNLEEIFSDNNYKIFKIQN